jgi:hypothetical protein
MASTRKRAERLNGVVPLMQRRRTIYEIQEITMRKLLLVAALSVSATLFTTGCATMGDTTPPLTLDSLVERAKKGESNESLLATLRGSRERFTLSGSEYAKLKERGLPDAVLDELQKRELESARLDERMNTHQIFWNPWWRGHYYYPIIHRPIVIPKPKI